MKTKKLIKKIETLQLEVNANINHSITILKNGKDNCGAFVDFRDYKAGGVKAIKKIEKLLAKNFKSKG